MSVRVSVWKALDRATCCWMKLHVYHISMKAVSIFHLTPGKKANERISQNVINLIKDKAGHVEILWIQSASKYIYDGDKKSHFALQLDVRAADGNCTILAFENEDQDLEDHLHHLPDVVKGSSPDSSPGS